MSAPEADILDQAANLTQTLTTAYVSNVQDAAKPEQKRNDDGTWPRPDCDCGEAIPAGRLALGKIRCVECQRDHEREQGARFRA